jgi:hypothetical protein
MLCGFLTVRPGYEYAYSHARQAAGIPIERGGMVYVISRGLVSMISVLRIRNLYAAS